MLPAVLSWHEPGAAKDGFPVKAILHPTLPFLGQLSHLVVLDLVLKDEDKMHIIPNTLSSLISQRANN